MVRHVLRKSMAWEVPEVFRTSNKGHLKFPPSHKVDITWGIFCPRRYDYQYLEVHPGVYLCLNHLLCGVAPRSWLLATPGYALWTHFSITLVSWSAKHNNGRLQKSGKLILSVSTHLPTISKFIFCAVQASFGRWRWAKFIGWKRRQTLGDPTFLRIRISKFGCSFFKKMAVLKLSIRDLLSRDIPSGNLT